MNRKMGATFNQPPIITLPDDYVEVKHLVLTSPSLYLLMNLFALLPGAIAFGLMIGWSALIQAVRGAWEIDMSPGLLLIVLIVIVPIHEALHGVVIWLAGYRPRFGMMLTKFVFYATADGYFRRDVFIAVALAPIVGITLIGAVVMWFASDLLAYALAAGIVMNAASAIGDLWMTIVALRYPAHALIRDEADSIRIYMPREQ